jgi:hypothetical protein
MTYNGLNRKKNKSPKSMAPHVRLEHCIKRSKAYHGLSMTARAALIELIDRYNGDRSVPSSLTFASWGTQLQKYSCSMRASPASTPKAM